MNIVGMKTDSSTRVMAMIGPVTWPMAFSVAWAGVSSGLVLEDVLDRLAHTMASSTTMPIASTRGQQRDGVQRKASASMTAKVPIRATARR